MDKIDLDTNIFLYNNFITKEESDILLNYAKSSNEEDWLEVVHQNENLLKKSPKFYNKYQEFKKDWDKTTLPIKNIQIVEQIKNRCQEVLGPDLLVTNDIYRIKRITDGRSISVHFDDSLNFSLMLGIVIYLNDDFQGGEIYYPEKNLSYKPQSRAMIIHPANEEYRHGINEVIGNTRYCLAFFATVY